MQIICQPLNICSITKIWSCINSPPHIL